MQSFAQTIGNSLRGSNATSGLQANQIPAPAPPGTSGPPIPNFLGPPTPTQSNGPNTAGQRPVGSFAPTGQISGGQQNIGNFGGGQTSPNTIPPDLLGVPTPGKPGSEGSGSTFGGFPSTTGNPPPPTADQLNSGTVGTFFDPLNSLFPGMGDVANNYNAALTNFYNSRFSGPGGAQDIINSNVESRGLGGSALGATTATRGAEDYFAPANAQIAGFANTLFNSGFGLTFQSAIQIAAIKAQEQAQEDYMRFVLNSADPIAAFTRKTGAANNWNAFDAAELANRAQIEGMASVKAFGANPIAPGFGGSGGAGGAFGNIPQGPSDGTNQTGDMLNRIYGGGAGGMFGGIGGQANPMNDNPGLPPQTDQWGMTNADWAAIAGYGANPIPNPANPGLPIPGDPSGGF